MVKHSTIETYEDKYNLISFLLTGTFPAAMNSLEKKKLQRKTKNFKYIDQKLVYMENGTAKPYICACEMEKKARVLQNHHMPGHVGRNTLYENIKQNHVGISQKDVSDFINGCSQCMRDTPPAIAYPLTPILPNFVKERLIVDTIDLSIYAQYNDGYRYIFTMVDSFSKFVFVFPSLRKDAESFSKILKPLFFPKAPGKYSIPITEENL